MKQTSHKKRAKRLADVFVCGIYHRSSCDDQEKSLHLVICNASIHDLNDLKLWLKIELT